MRVCACVCRQQGQGYFDSRCVCVCVNQSTPYIYMARSLQLIFQISIVVSDYNKNNNNNRQFASKLATKTWQTHLQQQKKIIYYFFSTKLIHQQQQTSHIPLNHFAERQQQQQQHTFFSFYSYRICIKGNCYGSVDRISCSTQCTYFVVGCWLITMAVLPTIACVTNIACVYINIKYVKLVFSQRVFAEKFTFFNILLHGNALLLLFCIIADILSSSASCSYWCVLFLFRTLCIIMLFLSRECQLNF